MIERELRDGVAILRLAHGKANALDTDLATAISRALDEERAASVVLTGRGGIFCAGVDLVRVASGGADYLRGFLPALDACLRKLVEFPRPLVAAINGHAIAGGWVIAAACDRRVMARGDGRVGVPELLVGIPFPALALELMRALLPPREFREAVLTGATHLPDAALARGFVDELSDAAVDRAVACAQQLARIPPATYALTKKQLRQPSATLDHDVEAAWLSDASLEAIRAYVAKTLKK